MYTCVRRLSDATSSVPWVLKRRTAEGDEEVEDHPAAELLARPNPRWSWQDMMQALTLDLNLGGNAYWLLLRKGKAQELWRLRPDRVRPIPDEKLFVSGYEWKVGQNKMTLPVRDDKRGMAVIHFRFIDPGNDVLGLAPLQAASRVVDTDNAAIDWNWAALRNQARPPGALSAPNKLTDAQYARLKTEIDEQIAGPDNARRPLLLEGGLQWQQHGFSPTDMDFLKGREANAIEICDIFGVRPEWAGIVQAKYENARQGRRMTWEDTIIAHLVDVRGTMNLQLAPIFDEDVFFDFDLSQTPAILEARGELIEQAKTVWSMGVPFNQVNEQFGLGFDPVPGGDTGYLPAILLPTSSAGEGERTAPAPELRVVNLETEEQKAAYWRAFDRQRQGWERGAAAKIKERFGAELAVLLKQLEAGVRDLDMVIGSELPAWEQLLTALWRAVFDHFGTQTAKALGMELKQIPGLAYYPDTG
ncbi:MAG TPA: phage portal protein, partial [Polyangia bacterium]|nr:phage portal protein [Polyangia bacterium]